MAWSKAIMERLTHTQGLNDWNEKAHPSYTMFLNKHVLKK